ncbi:hypothetical protein QLL95_gp0194 [Cotonvirus japonicus]|uniref:Uncharacterized protein n=1 Tax=Cotonvirus japonicus TaxID=2811091 RepID=A0ABM7NR90_9VIRU|nr:hypothetical protein QLL95_gp0194 [Cotonvirus japonicus]BCS82683.1 hypothetical protein [Cotonvirus japonicus]
MNDYPKIMKDLKNFLKENNHECVNITNVVNGKKQYKYNFKWCMQDVCTGKPSTINHPQNTSDEKKHPIIMDKMYEFLKQEGHACVGISGIYTFVFEWCMEDVCKYAISQRGTSIEQERQVNLLEKLKHQNHTCIKISEGYPIHVSWCGNEVCQKFEN